MRQTGKTTRLVDEAVQYLFEHGNIRVLRNHEIYNPYFIRGFKPERVDMFMKFIDPDARSDNKAQEHFIKMLEKRIVIEHTRSVKQINLTEYKVI